uniref:Fur family transcriptional regulator n=1 Tax=Romboutsia ilealis TaxID=1115758 RepID=UPI00272C8EEC
MSVKNEYNTEQRKLILKYLVKSNDTYLKAEDILKYMKKNNESIGLSTIYRFLNLLEEQGKLRTDIINHTKYFQYILDNCREHFHLKCEKCGKLIHFKCNEFKKLNEHILK